MKIQISLSTQSEHETQNVEKKTITLHILPDLAEKRKY